MESIAYVASLLALFAFIRSSVPEEVWDAILHFATSQFQSFATYLGLHSATSSCFYIHEYEESFNRNELYTCALWHLSSLSFDQAAAATLFSASDVSKIRFRLAENELLLETFEGCAVWWKHHVTRKKDEDDERFFTLRMRTSDRRHLLGRFLNYVRANGKKMELRNKERQLFTSDFRKATPFHHPASFDTLALDPVQKEEIVADLREFMEGEEFYKRAGRSWKRGYLLYGPPGTGKSSMIAAIANFTGYDVYDLELTAVSSNDDLRELLMGTTNKSIIVIEDIDCSLDLSDRAAKAVSHSSRSSSSSSSTDEDHAGKHEEASQVTLSGLLNFTDGLWSSCGSERIFVFTTNHVDKLDPALLRPGRMDMHIHLSYCTFAAFKILVKNYLGIVDHELFGEIEEGMAAANLTPASAAEMLILHKKNPSLALKTVLAALKKPAEPSK